MVWLLWILELLVPVTMALFGGLALRAGHKKAGHVLLGAAGVLALATIVVKLWQPLSPAVQSMVDVGVQLLVSLVVALYVGRSLTKK